MSAKKGRSTVMERPVGEVLRGGGKRLHRRRSRVAAGTRLLRRCSGRVRHQTNVDTAVCGAAFAGLVFLRGLVLAEPDNVDLVRRNVVLRTEILDHRVGTAFTETVVVIR